MKKSILLMTSLLSIMFLLAACGEDEKKTDEKEQVTSETTIFKGENGEVEFQANPEKIIVADSYVGFLLALDMKPAATSQFGLDVPAFDGMLDGVESFGDRSTPSLEKILDINPDLIIVDNHITDIEQLEKIAPVIVMEKKGYKELLVDFGEITGKKEMAETWINDWEKRINDLKPTVEEVIGDKTISILSPHAKGGIYAWGAENGRGGTIFYDAFAQKASAPIQEQLLDAGERWMDISMEMIPEYAGDIIITVPNDGDDADPAVVYDNPLWQNLPAVKNGLVYEIDDKIGSSFSDPISLEKRLDRIEVQILKK